MADAMNKTLKAVVIEITGGNVRNHHINLKGAFGLFPDDCLGGSNKHARGALITVRIGGETVETDIDAGKAIFRERAALKRYFEEERVSEGDLIVIERLHPREFQMWKASKRGFKYYL